jgi:hypothetical protein
MPWTEADVDKFHAGLDFAGKRRWLTIANSALAACKAKGGQGCDAYAVKVANARVAAKESKQETENVNLVESVALSEFAALSEDTGAKLDEENYVLRNTLLLGRHSQNGHDYTDQAIADYCRLAENAPVYIDHLNAGQKREAMKHGGATRNCHPTPEGARGDWFFTEDLLPRVRSAVRHRLPGIGMSLTGNGSFRGRGKGQRGLVEAYLSHQSTDFVASPATVNGLHESVQDGSSEAEAAAVAEAGTAKPEGDRIMDEQVKALTEQNTALAEQLRKITETLESEKAARVKAEAEKAHMAMVQEAVDASKKTVEPAVRKALVALTERADMDALLAVLPAKDAAKAAPVTEAKGMPDAAHDPAKAPVKLDAQTIAKGLAESRYQTVQEPGILRFGKR